MKHCKRSLFAGILTVIAFLLAAGCGGKNKVRVIKLAHALDVTHPVHKGMVFMQNKVAEFSEGKMRVDIYPGGQLGAERELIELLQIGSLAMTKVSTAPLEAFVPDMQIFGIPYVFRDDEHLWKILQGEIGQKLLLAGEKFYLRGLCYYDAGSRSFYTKDRPVKMPADIEGLKIRVMESPVMVDSMNAMGANAVPMGWAEVVTSLQQGLLDGQENPHLNILFANIHEICPVISETGHFYNPAIVIANLKWWNTLSDFEKKVFKDAAVMSAKYERWYIGHYNNWARDYMIEHGAKVVYAKEIDKEAFRKAVAPVYEKNLPKIPNGEAMLKQIRATK